MQQKKFQKHWIGVQLVVEWMKQNVMIMMILIRQFLIFMKVSSLFFLRKICVEKIKVDGSTGVSKSTGIFFIIAKAVRGYCIERGCGQGYYFFESWKNLRSRTFLLTAHVALLFKTKGIIICGQSGYVRGGKVGM